VFCATTLCVSLRHGGHKSVVNRRDLVEIEIKSRCASQSCWARLLVLYRFNCSGHIFTMVEVKTAESRITSTPHGHEEGEAQMMTEKGATTEDTRDMLRMGKTQETRRNFRSATILGFCLVILSMWETMLATSVFALSNGGTAGLIWGYLIVMSGFGFVVASLAEMASM